MDLYTFEELQSQRVIEQQAKEKRDKQYLLDSYEHFVREANQGRINQLHPTVWSFYVSPYSYNEKAIEYIIDRCKQIEYNVRFISVRSQEYLVVVEQTGGADTDFISIEKAQVFAEFQASRTIHDQWNGMVTDAYRNQRELVNYFNNEIKNNPEALEWTYVAPKYPYLIDFNELYQLFYSKGYLIHHNEIEKEISDGPMKVDVVYSVKRLESTNAHGFSTNTGNTSLDTRPMTN